MCAPSVERSLDRRRMPQSAISLRNLPARTVAPPWHKRTESVRIAGRIWNGGTTPMFRSTRRDFIALPLLSHPLPWRTALRDAMSVRYLRVLGVALVQIVAVGGTFIAAMMFAVLSTGLVLLALLIAAGFAAFLLIRWSLAFTTVGCENAGVSASFRRSWFLVKDEWWRVFGILALMTILLNFAIALITTPISMIASWDFYKEYFRVLGSAGKGQPDPTLVLRAMRSMGLGIGVAASISMMLQTLVKPIYTTVLFFDLRARNREFELTVPGLLFERPVDPAGSLQDGNTNGG